MKPNESQSSGSPLPLLPTPAASPSDGMTCSSGAGYPSAQIVNSNSCNNNAYESFCPTIQKVVKFWKNKRDNWIPPSRYIQSFKQIFRLHKLRDLMSQPEVVMETLFPGSVEYRIGPGKILAGVPTQVVWCRWSGCEDWIPHAAPVADGKRGVAMKAMTEVLGEQLTEYCVICGSVNYVGVEEEELVRALASEGLTEGKNQEQETEEGELWESEEESSLTIDQEAHQSPKAGSSTTAAATQSPSSAAAAGKTSKTEHAVRYFSDSILKMKRAKWLNLGREEKEQVLFNFWFDTSWEKDFPWTMNLLKQKDPLDREAVQAFMGLFSDGITLKKKGVKWLHNKIKKDSCSVQCIWHDQWNKEHRVEGTGENVDLARLDAAQKALKIIFCPEDLRVLQHVTNRFIYEGTKGERPRNMVVWEKLRDAKMQENEKEGPMEECPQLEEGESLESEEEAEALGPITQDDDEFGQKTVEEQKSKEQLDLQTEEELDMEVEEKNVESSELPRARELKAHPVRFLSDSILKMNGATWCQLTREEREQVLFDFWMQTSWGQGFPCIMNLMHQRNPLGKGALRAFILLFPAGRNSNKEDVKWGKISRKNGAFTVKCTWYDQWNKKNCVEGTGVNPGVARNNAAQNALQHIFCPEDLRVLRHLHSPVFYCGSPSQRVNLRRLFNRLREAKLRENVQTEPAGEFPGGRQGYRSHVSRVNSTSMDVEAESVSSATGIPTENINSSHDSLADNVLSYAASSQSQQLDDAGPPLSSSSLDSQNNSVETSAESSDSGPVRYFDDRILKITPGIWKTMSKDEREETLFDFWIQTSWGEGFPWTMNLVLQRNPFVAALPAFMLLFSEGRTVNKPGVEWRKISKENGTVTVECIWQDRWNNEHRVRSFGNTLSLARTNAARKALEFVFRPEDRRVLKHVNSPFFYDGRPSQRVNVDLLWNRLKEAKLQGYRPQLQAARHPEARQREPLRILSTDAQNCPRKRKKKEKGSTRKKRKENNPPGSDSDASCISVEIPNSSHGASVDSVSSHVPPSPSQQPPDAGPTGTEISWSQPEDQPVRYFGDRIFKITRKVWKNLSRAEREQKLFDFWIKTSWGAGFPMIMNLFQQRNPLRGGALAAFMLLFSNSRKMRKKGANWRTIRERKDSITIRCTWRDQWNNKHSVVGTGRSRDRAQINAAQKALKIVFCKQDLRVLRHVHSSFIYDGPEAQQVNVKRVWKRLMKAKMREKERNQRLGESPGGRQRKPRRSRSSGAQGEVNSMRQSDTVPDTPPEFIDLETQDSQSSIAESLPDDSVDDPFAEYFSNNDEGTIDIPEWIIEKYLTPSNEPTNIHSEDCSTRTEAAPSPDETDEDASFPYLPFDRLIGYEYPEEAAAALQVLFEDNKETGQPKFDMKKYFLAELQVGDQVFQALGLTEEEAQEAAAAKALEALSDNQEG